MQIQAASNLLDMLCGHSAVHGRVSFGGLKLRAHNAAKLKLGLVYTVHYTRDVHKRLCTHWVGRTWVRL